MKKIEAVIKPFKLEEVTVTRRGLSSHFFYFSLQEKVKLLLFGNVYLAGAA